MSRRLPKYDPPWEEVKRRRLTGDIRVGGKGSYVKIFYEVFERRVVDGEFEQRVSIISRTVRTDEIACSLLAEIVGRILPEIEDAAFFKIEEELKLRWEGHDLVSDPERSSPLAEALLGKDPF